MRTRTLQFGLVGLGLMMCGCGGQVSDSFANSVYVEIQSGGTLHPSSVVLPNNFRIVFLNEDTVDHKITWESPLALSATAPVGGRAWFELPPILPGSVMSYHLDNSGAGGSATVVTTP